MSHEQDYFNLFILLNIKKKLKYLNPAYRRRDA